MIHIVKYDHRIPSRTEWLIAIVTGCCLSGFVWNGLLKGGGLVGGDIYPYFFPQKQLMAEAFASGEIPLWHDRTSLGYPLHAESQAGVFYPPNQVLYRLCELNAAYSSSVLLHYALAFLFAWRFIRCQGLTPSSSLLAAMVFVYGWFPVRISLEWSIIGGVWFPLSLWMTDRLLNQPDFKRWSCLVICLGVHLLAGHFTLAFVTQLTCLAYVVLNGSFQMIRTQAATGSESQTAIGRFLHRGRAALMVMAAIACALLLAAVQIVPTIELHRLSQRDGSNPAFDPAYGHMPPVYLTQLVASWWYWHTPEIVLTREMLKYPLLMNPAGTNPVEAHLYVGLIPLCLIASLASRNVRRFIRRSAIRTWAVLSLAGVVYAFGWLVPLFRHLPGFGFFMGPGRYTMISQLGLVILAGLALDAFQRKQNRSLRFVITLVLAGVTLADVLKSAKYPVCDAQVVAEPPIRGLDSSWLAIRGLDSSWLALTLQNENRKSPVRLVAFGPNVANLYGVSCVPQYLGLGPSEYFSPEAKIETQPATPEQLFPSAELLMRLRAQAVTHLLTDEPVAHLSDECELVDASPDAFLNRVWARGRADCFLYRISETKSRISSVPAAALTKWSNIRRRPSDIEFEVELEESANVELCELMFPGWVVLIDGQHAKPISDSGFGRIVEVPSGRHSIRWIYQPWSFRIGLIISAATLLLLSGFFVRRSR